MFKNRNFSILMLIMVVNALSYGTIIPLLYPYATRFGFDPLGLSILFASFSIAQLIATPIIGRLSDKYGRKPLLLICLFGTAVSQALFALAGGPLMLIFARVLDGITGGNMSVAQAVIADTTQGNERAKGFGMLMATFGIGFLIGPAIGGLLSQIHPTAPFWFSAALALAGTVLGVIIMEETLPKTTPAQQAKQTLGLDPKTLVTALFMPAVGVIILMTFLTAIAQNVFIIGIQSAMVDLLKMNELQSGLVFTLFGLISIVMQTQGIKWLFARVKSKKVVIIGSLVASAAIMALLAFQTTIPLFIITSAMYGIAFSPLFAVVTGLISERTKSEDQGVILGINQSYMSLGQIIGPVVAGLIASRLSISAVFIAASGFFLLSLLATRNLFPVPAKKADL